MWGKEGIGGCVPKTVGKLGAASHPLTYTYILCYALKYIKYTSTSIMHIHLYTVIKNKKNRLLQTSTKAEYLFENFLKVKSHSHP